MITSQLVKSLWMDLSVQFRSRVIDKRGRLFMRFLAFFVALGSPMSKADFLESYATTIFRRIYVPFKVGVADENWSLYQQFTLAVHEHQHVVQSRRDGWLRYAWRYLRSTRARALYEAECLLCEYICADRLDVPTRPPSQRAAEFRSYGLTDADVLAIQEYVEKSLADGYVPKAAKAMLRHLEIKVLLDGMHHRPVM